MCVVKGTARSYLKGLLRGRERAVSALKSSEASSSKSAWTRVRDRMVRYAACTKSHRAGNAFSNVDTVQRLSPVWGTRSKLRSPRSLSLILSISQFFDALGLGRTYQDSGKYGQVRAPPGWLQVGACPPFGNAPLSYLCKTFSISQKRFKVLTDKEPKCRQSENFEKVSRTNNICKRISRDFGVTAQLIIWYSEYRFRTL